MTFSDIISRLEEQIRDSRAWPDNAVGNKLEQQIRLVYGAALVVAKRLPLSRFSGSQTSSGLSSGAENGYFKFTLPADIFVCRPDFGILNMSFSGTVVDVDSSEVFVTLSNFREEATNKFQRENLLVHITWDERVIRATEDSCTLKYVPLFTEPTTGNYDATDFPLSKTHDEEVIQLVASHVQAVLAGNRSKSVIHNALVEVYGYDNTLASEA